MRLLIQNKEACLFKPLLKLKAKLTLFFPPGGWRGVCLFLTLIFCPCQPSPNPGGRRVTEVGEGNEGVGMGRSRWFSNIQLQNSHFLLLPSQLGQPAVQCNR